MNDLQQSVISPKELLRLLAVHWRLWLVPATIVSLGALAYALIAPDTWEASQALIVRNVAVNNYRGLGKFDQPDEMKATEETILELARSRGVLKAALKKVGSPIDYRHPEQWPTDRDIQKLSKVIKIRPPKGAEFGKTEIFYLTVRDSNRTRAIALNKAIFSQLQIRFQELRDAKGRSIIDELTKTVVLAKADLADSTSHLSAVEKKVGVDLGELRAMQDIGASDSSLRRSAEDIRTALRETQSNYSTNQELLAFLKAAQEDPGRLESMPNRLLASQPALKRLKDGLVDAQLAKSKLLGKMTSEHPLVKAARESELEIGRHLHDELALAVCGIKLELRLNKERQSILESQLAKTSGRLKRLAEIRASYENLAAENRNRTQLAQRAEQTLAEARAALAGAKASCLISRIDQPDTGANPVGLAKSLIIVLGIVGGLITGLGVLYLALPSQVHTTVLQEEKTCVNYGRRLSGFQRAASGVKVNGFAPHSIKTALEKIHLNGIF